MASGYSDLSEIRKNSLTFNNHPKPPKINLLNEQPRRESLVEQHLTTLIRPTTKAAPFVEQDSQFEHYETGRRLEHAQQSSYNQPQQSHNQLRTNSANTSQHQHQITHDSIRGYTNHGIDNHNQNYTSSGYNALNDVDYYQPQPSNSRGDYGSYKQHTIYPSGGEKTVTTTVTTVRDSTNSYAQPQKQQQQQQQQQQQPHYQQQQQQALQEDPRPQQQHYHGISSQQTSSTFSRLEKDLAEKEAKLRCEIAYLNQYKNQWSRPKQVREPRKEAPSVLRKDPKWNKEFASATSSRPTSRASSTRSTAEHDLNEKAAKLLQDVEELEKKPLITQKLVIDHGGRSSEMKSQSKSPQENVNSIHTAVIKVPVGEVDNKSPLPFAFDNFSTRGVRGNIASVGAAQPEKPYPPIFPQIKKTPSPTWKG